MSISRAAIVNNSVESFIGVGTAHAPCHRGTAALSAIAAEECALFAAKTAKRNRACLPAHHASVARKMHHCIRNVDTACREHQLTAILFLAHTLCHECAVELIPVAADIFTHIRNAIFYCAAPSNIVFYAAISCYRECGISVFQRIYREVIAYAAFLCCVCLKAAACENEFRETILFIA